MLKEICRARDKFPRLAVYVFFLIYFLYFPFLIYFLCFLVGVTFPLVDKILKQCSKKFIELVIKKISDSVNLDTNPTTCKIVRLGAFG